jgi:hypothetical protein
MRNTEERALFEKTLETITSPEPLETIEELEDEVELRPRYVGPGLWYALIASAADSADSTEDRGARRQNGRNRGTAPQSGRPE